MGSSTDCFLLLDPSWQTERGEGLVELGSFAWLCPLFSLPPCPAIRQPPRLALST